MYLCSCCAMLCCSMHSSVPHPIVIVTPDPMYHSLPFGIQDDKAVDKAWKKESAEAGDGMGQVLYQLFKKRRSAYLPVCCCWVAYDASEYHMGLLGEILVGPTHYSFHNCIRCR